ncbi:hypothetical protein FA95DRAFT_1578880 [Auriscalpium vulgare]|uniref:Uncharacterized protein n=1 Tax=Auriscalpium vulgare TaxID=40419 RepID=A0ACB8QZS0_9AGAM|nr:hypothetical protein FA95DRAFT_1578880 [Auriscalpium vulgare]
MPSRAVCCVFARRTGGRPSSAHQVSPGRGTSTAAAEGPFLRLLRPHQVTVKEESESEDDASPGPLFPVKPLSRTHEPPSRSSAPPASLSTLNPLATRFVPGGMLHVTALDFAAYMDAQSTGHVPLDPCSDPSLMSVRPDTSLMSVPGVADSPLPQVTDPTMLVQVVTGVYGHFRSRARAVISHVRQAVYEIACIRRAKTIEEGNYAMGRLEAITCRLTSVLQELTRVPVAAGRLPAAFIAPMYRNPLFRGSEAVLLETTISLFRARNSPDIATLLNYFLRFRYGDDVLISALVGCGVLDGPAFPDLFRDYDEAVNGTERLARNLNFEIWQERPMVWQERGAA